MQLSTLTARVNVYVNGAEPFTRQRYKSAIIVEHTNSKVRSPDIQRSQDPENIFAVQRIQLCRRIERNKFMMLIKQRPKQLQHFTRVHLTLDLRFANCLAVCDDECRSLQRANRPEFRTAAVSDAVVRFCVKRILDSGGGAKQICVDEAEPFFWFE